MPRLSKTEQARRQERQMRAEKAIESLTGQFRKLLTKHAGNLFKVETEIQAGMGLRIDNEGNAELNFSYTTTVSDGARFPLDDGQEELPGIQPPGEKERMEQAIETA